MKAWQSILLIVGALAVAGMLTQSSSAEARFEEWKTQFGFHFEGEHDNYRRIIFMNNLDTIERHNAEGKHSWTLGVNQFTHLTSDEFEAKFLGRYHSHEQQAVAVAEDEPLSE